MEKVTLKGLSDPSLCDPPEMQGRRHDMPAGMYLAVEDTEIWSVRASAPEKPLPARSEGTSLASGMARRDSGGASIRAVNAPGMSVLLSYVRDNGSTCSHLAVSVQVTGRRAQVGGVFGAAYLERRGVSRGAESTCEVVVPGIHRLHVTDLDGTAPPLSSMMTVSAARLQLVATAADRTSGSLTC